MVKKRRAKKSDKFYPTAEDHDKLKQRMMKLLLVELERLLERQVPHPEHPTMIRPTLAQCYVAVIKALPGSEKWKEESFSAAVSELSYGYMELLSQRTRRREAALMLKAKRNYLSTVKKGDADVHG